MIYNRKLKLSIQIADSVKIFESDGSKKTLRISGSGKKFTTPNQNEATIKVFGLNGESLQYLLSTIGQAKTQSQNAFIQLEVGRENADYFIVFKGDIIDAKLSTAPDLAIELKCKTNNANNRKVIVSSSAYTNLQNIASQVANNNGLSLLFQATNKNIKNYQFAGSASAQVESLSKCGGVNCFIDDTTLVVKDFDDTVTGRRRILNVKSGLVGIPQATEIGVDVTYLIAGESMIGGQITLESAFNKSLNGDYEIQELSWDVASHENNFFYKAKCRRM